MQFWNIVDGEMATNIVRQIELKQSHLWLYKLMENTNLRIAIKLYSKSSGYSKSHIKCILPLCQPQFKFLRIYNPTVLNFWNKNYLPEMPKIIRPIYHNNVVFLGERNN